MIGYRYLWLVAYIEYDSGKWNIEHWGMATTHLCLEKQVNMFEQGIRHHNSPINEITPAHK